MAITNAQLDAKVQQFWGEGYFRLNPTDLAGLSGGAFTTLTDGTVRYNANMSPGLQQPVYLVPRPYVNVGDILVGL